MTTTLTLDEYHEAAQRLHRAWRSVVDEQRTPADMLHKLATRGIPPRCRHNPIRLPADTAYRLLSEPNKSRQGRDYIAPEAMPVVTQTLGQINSLIANGAQEIRAIAASLADQLANYPLEPDESFPVEILDVQQAGYESPGGPEVAPLAPTPNPDDYYLEQLNADGEWEPVDAWQLTPARGWRAFIKPGTEEQQ